MKFLKFFGKSVLVMTLLVGGGYIVGSKCLGGDSFIIGAVACLIGGGLQRAFFVTDDYYWHDG